MFGVESKFEEKTVEGDLKMKLKLQIRSEIRWPVLDDVYEYSKLCTSYM